MSSSSAPVGTVRAYQSTSPRGHSCPSTLPPHHASVSNGQTCGDVFSGTNGTAEAGSRELSITHPLGSTTEASSPPALITPPSVQPAARRRASDSWDRCVIGLGRGLWVDAVAFGTEDLEIVGGAGGLLESGGRERH